MSRSESTHKVFLLKSKARFLNWIVLCILIIGTVSLNPISASATLTALSDTMTRLEKSQTSNHTIKFTTSAGAGDITDTITITMPDSFGIGSVDYTDIDLSYGASTGAETEATLADSASDTAWGASFSGQVLTLTHPTDGATGDIAASDKVIVEIGTNADSGNAQITNINTANTYTISIGGTFGDTGKIAIVILDDDNVIVNASIDPSITFSLSANSTDFGVLSPGVVDTADTNVTLTVGTNAASGYTISVRDAGNTTNPGLYNSSATAIIGSADGSYNDTGDLSSVGSGYGLQIACTAGCTTGTHVNTRWRQGSNVVGGLELTDTEVVTFSSTLSADHTLSVVHKAKSSSTHSAGTYTDTLTYIATGNF